jgi:tetratricopeptide (TPR) repeat protein
VRIALHLTHTGSLWNKSEPVPPDPGLGADMTTALKRMTDDRDDLQLLYKLYATLSKIGRPKSGQTEGDPVHSAGVTANRAGFQSYQILLKLVKAYPEEPAYREDHAKNLEAMGSAQDLRKALDLWTQLAADFPREPKYRFRLVDLQRRQKNFEQALKLATRLVADFPEEPDGHVELAVIHYDFAEALKSQGAAKRPEMEDHIRTAIELAQRVKDKFPTIEINRTNLGLIWLNLATLLPEGKEKERLYRQALDLTAKELAENPTAPVVLRMNFAIIHRNLAIVTTGKESIWHARKSLEIMTQLTTEYPSNKEYKDKLRNCNGFLVWHLIFGSDGSARDPLYAIELLETAEKSGAPVQPSSDLKALAHIRLGEGGKAIEILEKTPNPDSEEYYLLSLAYSRVGQVEKARAEFARAEQWMKANKKTPEWLKDFDRLLLERAEAAAFLGIHDFVVPVPKDRLCLAQGYWAKGDKEQALKWYHEGVQWMKKNAPKDEELEKFRIDTETLVGLRPVPAFEPPAVWPPRPTTQAKVPTTIPASGGR